MAKHRRFQFGLLRLLGFVTVVAVILAVPKTKLMVASVLTLFSSFMASAGVVVLSAAFIRDAREAKLRKRWHPLMIWFSWPVLYLLAAVGFCFFILWEISSDLTRPFGWNAWMWLVDSGMFMGLAVGIWHITRRHFWKFAKLTDG